MISSPMKMAAIVSMITSSPSGWLKCFKCFKKVSNNIPGFKHFLLQNLALGGNGAEQHHGVAAFHGDGS